MTSPKNIKKALVLAAIFTAAGIVAYKVLLTREARDGLRHAAGAVNRSYHRVTDAIQDVTGIVMDEGYEALPNRDAAIQQWEALGY